MRFGLLYEAQRPFKGTNVDWNTLHKERAKPIPAAV